MQAFGNCPEKFFACYFKSPDRQDGLLTGSGDLSIITFSVYSSHHTREHRQISTGCRGWCGCSLIIIAVVVSFGIVVIHLQHSWEDSLEWGWNGIFYGGWIVTSHQLHHLLYCWSCGILGTGRWAVAGCHGVRGWLLVGYVPASGTMRTRLRIAPGARASILRTRCITLRVAVTVWSRFLPFVRCLVKCRSNVRPFLIG